LNDLAVSGEPEQSAENRELATAEIAHEIVSGLETIARIIHQGSTLVEAVHLLGKAVTGKR
jgi:hypothetical protein